jgi:hypothetical protein
MSNVTRVGVNVPPPPGTDPDHKMVWSFSEVSFDGPAPGSSEQQPRSVKVDGQVTVFVALQNVAMPFAPVDRTLEQVVKCVADIVPRFEKFF